MRAGQKATFENKANEILFSLFESDSILRDRMRTRFDILGFLNPSGAKPLLSYLKKKMRQIFFEKADVKKDDLKKAIFEAVTSLKMINSVRQSHDLDSVKSFKDIIPIKLVSESLAKDLKSLEKKINDCISFFKFYFEDPLQELISLEENIEKIDDFLKLEEYNRIVETFESDSCEYINKKLPVILLQKIIDAYAKTAPNDFSCDTLVDMKDRCENFHRALLSEAEPGVAGLLFEIALFKCAVADFDSETNSKTAVDIVKKSPSFCEKNSSDISSKIQQGMNMFGASMGAYIAKSRTPAEVLKFIRNIEDILNDHRLKNADKKDLLLASFEEMKIEDERLLRIFKTYKILASDGNLNAEMFPGIGHGVASRP